jgi:hypothetical protein
MREGNRLFKFYIGAEGKDCGRGEIRENSTEAGKRNRKGEGGMKKDLGKPGERISKNTEEIKGTQNNGNRQHKKATNKHVDR